MGLINLTTPDPKLSLEHPTALSGKTSASHPSSSQTPILPISHPDGSTQSSTGGEPSSSYSGLANQAVQQYNPLRIAQINQPAEMAENNIPALIDDVNHVHLDNGLINLQDEHQLLPDLWDQDRLLFWDNLNQFGGNLLVIFAWDLFAKAFQNYLDFEIGLLIRLAFFLFNIFDMLGEYFFI
ncbi:uncharacterized protein PGTG_06902 [Puccinia graminis f. sp. tritici CRL 75-36-700-3]|uniref:Uncharacterized protein n=1 Tax=Puccinia graminis f. sp. tritici (strain CRL 75-36-700-3 / race SCCL) TaxID=418459 RepID=E3KAC4_PUCGT|nr:uncharacterized protein PGTG_06902 [Puccinia graminis f. sp. tritici CRL 75-36-700-3]EFP81281.2 hypothetical protein PGTG_06902 [Puccinia graminis f. sp. tritici CRL 75-36-700-3]